MEDGKDNKPEPKPYKRMEFEDRDDNKNFYDQFDRESPLFHGGLMTPVPYGEGIQQVPKSMPTEFPDGFDPEKAAQPDPANSDPQVVQFTEAMGGFRDFKKIWSKVADLFVARGQGFEKDGHKEGQAPEAYVDSKIRDEIAKAAAFEATLSANPHFVGYQDGQNKLLAWVETVGTDLKKGREDSKTEITTFTRLLFKLQNECMAKIKDRKKQLKAAQQ